MNVMPPSSMLHQISFLIGFWATLLSPNWWSLYVFEIEALTIGESLHFWIFSDKLPNLIFSLVVYGESSASAAASFGSFRGSGNGY